MPQQLATPSGEFIQDNWQSLPSIVRDRQERKTYLLAQGLSLKQASCRYHPLTKCETCPLQGKEFVPGFGSLTADIAWVGESPGGKEMAWHKPFIGPSGHLLKTVLQSEGFDLSKCWFTNAAMCLVSEDDERFDQEIEACSERLFSELGQVSPRLVVALGADALYALTGREEKITVVAGNLFKSKPYNGTQFDVLPVIHPAFVLHNEGEQANFKHQVQMAYRTLYGPGDERLIDPLTRLVPKDLWKTTCNFLMEKGRETGKLLVDIESTAFDPFIERLLIVGISPDGYNSYLFPISAIDDEGTAQAEWSRPVTEIVSRTKGKRLFKQLDKVLSCKDYALEGHNVDFDQKWLRSRGFSIRFTRDSFLADYTLNEQSGGHGLKALVNYHFGNEDWEKEAKRTTGKLKNYADMPLANMIIYAGKDVAFNWHLGNLQRNTLMGPDEIKVHDEILIPCMHTFSDTSLRGYKIDIKKSMELYRDLSAQLESFREKIQDLVEIPDFNPASPIKVSAYLYDELGLPESFGRNSQAKTLRSLQSYCIDRIDSGNDPYGDLVDALSFLEAKLEFASLNKELGNYVVGIVRKLSLDLRLHPRTRLSGTVTGRIAMDDPSLLNFLKGSRTREQIVPDNDKYYIAETDAAQFELRFYGVETKDEDLIKGFSDPNFDPHAAATDLIFKDVIKYCRLLGSTDILEIAEQTFLEFVKLARGSSDYINEEARRALFYSGVGDWSGDWSKYTLAEINKAFSDTADIYRRSAKTVVFGLLYNRGATALARAYRISRFVALEWIEAIKGGWTGIVEYENRIQNILLNDGVITSMFGRKRRAIGLSNENWHEWYNAFINFPIQSACNDINMLNMNLLYSMEDELGIKVMWPIHDSQIYQVLRDGWRERVAKVESILDENTSKLVGTPKSYFKFESKVGENWYVVKDTTKIAVGEL